MTDEDKIHGGGYLSEEGRTWEETFIKEAAEALAKELTEGTQQEIGYDSEQRRWYYREGTADASRYMETFRRELEQMRKNKVRSTRWTRAYESEITELMCDVWVFTEWIRRSLKGEDLCDC